MARSFDKKDVIVEMNMVEWLRWFKTEFIEPKYGQPLEGKKVPTYKNLDSNTFNSFWDAYVAGVIRMKKELMVKITEQMNTIEAQDEKIKELQTIISTTPSYSLQLIINENEELKGELDQLDEKLIESNTEINSLNATIQAIREQMQLLNMEPKNVDPTEDINQQA